MLRTLRTLGHDPHQGDLAHLVDQQDANGMKLVEAAPQVAGCVGAQSTRHFVERNEGHLLASETERERAHIQDHAERDGLLGPPHRRAGVAGARDAA